MFPKVQVQIPLSVDVSSVRKSCNVLFIVLVCFAKRFLCYLGSFETVVMKPDNPGEWAVVCRTNDHFEAGMVAKFRVNKCNLKLTTKVPPTKKQTFYIAAVEVEWDYGPSGENKINGINFDADKYVAY